MSETASSAAHQTPLAEMLQNIYWDTPADIPGIIGYLLEAKPLPVEVDKSALYRRLLESYNWYALQQTLPHHILKEALSEENIQKLHWPDLKQRYEYVRKRLF